MAAMTEIEAYYNKFNEEKRLDSRHGRVEFNTSMKYMIILTSVDIEEQLTVIYIY